jgi:hypothetical protein
MLELNASQKKMKNCGQYTPVKVVFTENKKGYRLYGCTQNVRIKFKLFDTLNARYSFNLIRFIRDPVIAITKIVYLL